MANKKVSQLTSKPSVLTTDLFPIADPTTGQLYKTTISDLGTAIGSGVSSVNGLVGAVVLDTDDIQELVSPTNKWFTDTRARAALSASSPLTYNSGTGVFGIQVANGSQNGYLSSADWTTFNGKQAALSGTGFVKISGTTISYDNSNYLPTTLTTTAKTVLLNGQQFSIYGNPGGVFTSGRIIVDDLFGAVGYQVSGVFYGLKIDTSGNAYFDNSGTTRFYNSVRFDSTLTNGTYTYTLPGATGTIALTSDLSSLISGSGTSGIVPKFTGTGSIGNSQIYDNGTRVSIGADVTTTNKFTAVSSTTSAYAVVAQASSAAHGIWSNVLGSGEIFRGQTAGGSYFIINNGGNAFLNGNLNVGDFALTSYRLNVVGTANFTGALSGTSATFTTANDSSINLRSGATGSFTYLNIGRTVREGDFAISASSGGFATGSVAGDLVVNAALSTNSLILATNSIGRLFITSTGAATFSSSVTQSASDSRLLGGDSVGRYIISNSDTSAYTAIYGSSHATSANQISLITNSQITFNSGTGYSERMRITSSGNVGIGTTAPASKLHIEGTGTGAWLTINRTDNGTNLVDYTQSGTRLGYIGYIGSELWINNATASDISIRTSGSERMRITSAGDLIFTGQSSSKIQFYNSYSGSPANVGLALFNTSGTTVIALNANGGGIYTASLGTGLVYSSGGSLTSTNPSDSRLKKNIKTISYGLSDIMKLRPVSYDWKEDKINQGIQFGFIAQEVQEVMPDAIKEFGEETKFLGLEKDAIYATLVNAVKELKAELDTLKNK